MYILLQKRLFVNIWENKATCNFINAELRQKSHRNCVFSRFAQKSFRQKIPRDLRFLTSFVNAGRCAFLSTDFSRNLLVHSFLRFFTGFCIYALFLAWFSTRSIKWGGILLKTKCKRHCGRTSLFLNITGLRKV